MRVKFCGSIMGSVAKRRGETDEEAIARAEQFLLALMEKSARSLSQREALKEGVRQGPNLCLEPDETED